jgi:VRR-NUC domain
MKQAIKMKATGYVKGVPDLQIFEAVGNYHGLLIEIKDLKGVVSKEQKEWIKKLNDRGYYATDCKGVESTIKVIDDYLAGKI